MTCPAALRPDKSPCRLGPQTSTSPRVAMRPLAELSHKMVWSGAGSRHMAALGLVHVCAQLRQDTGTRRDRL